MAESTIRSPIANPSVPAAPGHHVPFGVNEMRLAAPAWAATIGLLTLAIVLIPRLWTKLERFETGPDYRIPYNLSKDYWLFERRLNEIHDSGKVVVLGDSVVWGEYVQPDGTLPHFLSAEAGHAGAFVNVGVNGLFPLALEGLVRYYGGAIQQGRVVLQCNVLWMSSPKADLQIEKEEKFNHSRLVPQYSPRIPCYRADANERLSAMIERRVRFVSWVGHLQSCYFGDKSILSWTLEEDGNDPLTRPNAYKNPLAQIVMEVPAAPVDDPQRGPSSPRHKAWTSGGGRPVRFDWVTLDHSLQWGAFQRLVQLLQERGNEVLVVLGPFNEHMIAAESQPAYAKLREGIVSWLTEHQVQHVQPEILPSALYADASHPLTEGYALLAKKLYADPTTRHWLGPSFGARAAPGSQQLILCTQRGEDLLVCRFPGLWPRRGVRDSTRWQV